MRRPDLPTNVLAPMRWRTAIEIGDGEMAKARLAAAAVAGAMGLAGGASAASLVGDTVHMWHDYPDLGTLYADDGTAVVGVSTPTFPNVENYGWLDVNITAHQIIFNWTAPVYALSAAFNGFVLQDLTNPFPGATLDAATNTSGISLGFSSGLIELNLQGFTAAAGQNITIDVPTYGVPEPAGWGMMIFGLGLTGIALRRRALVAVPA
jgi:hypothetical protein